MRPSFRTRTTALCGALVTIVLLAPAARAASYTIDPVHSSAVFKIRHFGVSNIYGVFWEVSGTVDYDSENPTGASLEVSISTESLDTHNDRRNAHIKSPDFLDVKQFPVIHFKSTAVKELGEDRFEVTGDFTLHGVTREITVTAEKIGQGAHPRSGVQMIGFEAHFIIDRTDFDMSFMAGPLGEEVHISLSFEASQE